MALVVGTAEQRLDQADEKILLMTKVNDDLASIVGELRNEIISLREELISKRELITAVRHELTYEVTTFRGASEVVVRLRRLLGVNY